MKKLLMIVIAVMVISVPASAGWWTIWEPGWGAGAGVINAEGPTSLAVSLTKGGSSCFYQEIPVYAGVEYTLSTSWKGSDATGSYWGEVMVIDGPWTTQVDDGGWATANALVAKHDAWELGPSTWNWEDPSAAPYYNPAFRTRVASSNVMTIVFKLGGNPGAGNTLQADCVGLCIVPEPGSLLALGTGLIGMAGFVVRRRR